MSCRIKALNKGQIIGGLNQNIARGRELPRASGGMLHLRPVYPKMVEERPDRRTYQEDPFAAEDLGKLYPALPRNTPMSQNTQTNDLAIHADRLVRHYKMGDAVIRAVDGVSLDVPQGQFLALLGASGSGKSSLMNLFAGLDHATGGTLFVLGAELGKMNSAELSRHRNQTIGMVFQSFNLLPRMNVMEN